MTSDRLESIVYSDLIVGNVPVSPPKQSKKKRARTRARSFTSFSEASFDIGKAEDYLESEDIISPTPVSGTGNSLERLFRKLTLSNSKLKKSKRLDTIAQSKGNNRLAEDQSDKGSFSTTGLPLPKWNGDSLNSECTPNPLLDLNRLRTASIGPISETTSQLEDFETFVPAASGSRQSLIQGKDIKLTQTFYLYRIDDCDGEFMILTNEAASYLPINSLFWLVSVQAKFYILSPKSLSFCSATYRSASLGDFIREEYHLVAPAMVEKSYQRDEDGSLADSTALDIVQGPESVKPSSPSSVGSLSRASSRLSGMFGNGKE